MNIVQVTEKDAGRIAAIVCESNKDVAELFNINRDNNPKHPSFCTKEWVLSDFARGEEYFICKNGDTFSGCVAFEQPDPDTAYLNRLAVLPEFRHNGIGAALVKHIIWYSKSKNIRVISIGIIAAHELLKSWYSGLGFVEKNTIKIDHLPFDVTFMHYNL